MGLGVWWGLAPGLAPGPAAAVPGSPAGGRQQRAPERVLEGVGRWERSLRRCRLERQPPGLPSPGLPNPERPAAGNPAAGPQRRSCRGVRLDQQLPGLLSLRLVGAELQRGAAPGQLVFAGVLEPGSQPLVCRQLRCRPEGAVRLQVSAVARSAMPHDPAGAPLLHAQRAQGRCDLERGRLTCRVRGDDGEGWRVEANP